MSIKLSKWKRWSREFLPPDTLSGLQSGYARQFSLKEAFLVYLGGCLVGTLKFSVPETRRILSDLNAWLRQNGYFEIRPIPELLSREPVDFQVIYIFKTAKSRFGYTIRRVIDTESDERKGIRRESCRTVQITSKADSIVQQNAVSARVLFISTLYNRFLHLMHDASEG